MVFVLSYSRMMHISYQTRPYNTEDFIKSHIEANTYFGGIAKEYVYDQTKLVAIHEKYREVLFNKKFYQFAIKCGFEARVCEGYDPESKGKVERCVGYIKDSFFRGEKFNNIEEVRSSGREWLDTVANVRIHGTTKRKPLEMFIKEKDNLSSPKYVAIIDKDYRQVDKIGLISVKGNKYSVPFQYQRKKVAVQQNKKTIEIFDLETGKLAASHTVPDTKGNIIKNNNHYRDYRESTDKISLLS